MTTGPARTPDGPQHLGEEGTGAPQPLRHDGRADRTLVHVVRHGEVHNPEGILYGRLPGYHLSDRGRAMADLVAQSLQGHDIALLVASPLERAQETAAPLAAATGRRIETDVRVIESENSFEGRRVGSREGALRDPKSWPLLWNPLRPSWGEAYRTIAARMDAALREAARAARGHEAVIVSHQLPIWTLRSHLEGRPLAHDPRRRECSLASVTTFDLTGDEVYAVHYSEPAAELLPGASPVPGA
ncbi:histidine phosphatase family protein [Kytococcus sedentarius]|uniref:histidine phosphatase family protein n=1 Tax=Kytococcus sedentarius TaxID=1276 RepID=UPI0035BBF061